MWDLPGPGLELVSPALAGGFLITVPPGKPHLFPILTITNKAAINICVQVFVQMYTFFPLGKYLGLE